MNKEEMQVIIGNKTPLPSTPFERVGSEASIEHVARYVEWLNAEKIDFLMGLGELYVEWDDEDKKFASLLHFRMTKNLSAWWVVINLMLFFDDLGLICKGSNTDGIVWLYGETKCEYVIKDNPEATKLCNVICRRFFLDDKTTIMHGEGFSKCLYESAQMIKNPNTDRNLLNEILTASTVGWVMNKKGDVVEIPSVLSTYIFNILSEEGIIER